MKILFVGADNFWAEGVRYLLEDIYEETVKLVSVQDGHNFTNQTGVMFEEYHFVFVDLMSYVPALYGNLYLTLNKATEKIVFITSVNSPFVNIHRNLRSKSIKVSKDATLQKMKVDLLMSCICESNNIIPCDANQSGFKRTRDIMSAFELEVIRSISTGEKVKSIAIRMNKSDKSIYHLLSKIKLRMGFKSNHEFLSFLSTFNAYKIER
ncbi:hypothetical protein ABK735_21890 [Enterobacter kobei]|uniref:hypothetical protein n=1 Tax=Enterobacter kobei TaxID=208224 RepID=UPI003752A9D3